MKYSGKPILIFLIMLMLAASQVFAIDFSNLQSNVNSFAEDMSKALPFNSTIGLNWSDAYVGNFPSFGIGLSAGLTTMGNKSISNMTDLFNIPRINDLPLFSNNIPFPGYSVDARIGVPSIPVDFGIKFGYLPQSWLESLLNIGIKNMLIGADVRYAVINSKVIPMRLSVGLGFNYLNGGISKTFSNSSLEFIDIVNDLNLNVNDPKVDITWRTTSIEFKMQASFPFRIVTPYAGAGISYSWSKAGYKVSSAKPVIDETLKAELGKLDLTNVSENSFETIIKSPHHINTRVFGGLSFNLVYVRLDLTAMYEILNRNFGASFGLRFQM